MEQAPAWGGIVLQFGVVGFWLYLFLTGRLPTQAHLEAVQKVSDERQRALDAERSRADSLEKTVDALSDNGKLAVTLLQEIRTLVART